MGIETIVSIITIIGVPIAGVGGWIAKVLIDKRKQASDTTLSANDQAFLIYKNLIEILQKNLSQINADQTKLEQEFLLTRELNVELRMINKYLTEKNKELTDKILDKKILTENIKDLKIQCQELKDKEV